MTKAMKAALLSALLFPGAGHFFLKRYVSGVVLAGLSCAGLYILITKMVEKTLLLAEKIQTGQVRLDITAMTELVTSQTTSAEVQLLNIATAVIIITWLLSIIDSYRIGYGQEKKHSP